jgi:molybdopterin converting factor small subunit
MRVTVRYQTQIRRALGVAAETVEMSESCALADLTRHLGARHGETFRRLVLTEAGEPHESVLVFVGDRQVCGAVALRDGDVVTLLAPMAGG